VAVVTSQSGAALHDILNVSRLRSPWIPIVLVPVAVQGADAGKEIAAGIRKADTETDADVIIVGRGGGSAEDLWCFNDEAVVRAVAACRKPVVSGVGHEIDHTLCDLAADVRASTPSNAAEIVFPDRKELRSRVRMIGSALAKAQTETLRRAELSVRTVQQRLSALSPEKRIASLLGRSQLTRERMLSVLRSALEGKTSELKTARSILERAAYERVRETENRTARLKERLTAVNPLAVLNRGYALVYDGEGKILTRAAEAKTRREMTLQFGDGRVGVTRKDET
jgi:exodeoxyribonuclease VII large subunit